MRSMEACGRLPLGAHRSQMVASTNYFKIICIFINILVFYALFRVPLHLPSPCHCNFETLVWRPLTRTNDRHSSLTWVSPTRDKHLFLGEKTMKIRPSRALCHAVLLSLGVMAGPTWAATLVGHWAFDEGSGGTTADSSGFGNTGTLLNSPAWVAGKSGKALDFKNLGSAYVAVPGAGSLANLYTQGVTVAAWIKPRSAGTSALGRIVDKENNKVGWLFAMSEPAMLRFVAHEFAGDSATRVSTTRVTLNQWQHVAATWDGSTKGANIHIYLNGVLVDGATTDGTGPLSNDSTTPLSIGNRSYDLYRSFDGGIDEVNVYSGVLSAAQIAALAGSSPSDTQAPTVPSGLAASNVTATGATLGWQASADLPNPGGTGVGGYFVYRNNGASPIATVTTGASFTDTGLTASTTYTYQVAAFDKASPANVSARSTALSVTTQSGSSPGWSSSDVGAVGATGASSSSGGTTTIQGSGADIYGTADSFHFDWQSFSGDGSITARVVSQTQTNAWAKAGVMFRESTSPGSKFATMLTSAANGAVFEDRATTGAAVLTAHGPAVRNPYWVRLVRANNVLTGFISTDGVSWTQVASATVVMATSLDVGLAVTSHAAGTLSTAVFDNVTITSGSSGSTPTVTVAPAITSLTVGSTRQFVAAVSDASAVIWTVDGITGGNSTVGSISQTGLYTAGSAAGTHSVVVTSAAHSNVKASAVAAVTDLAGVYTYRNNGSRNGANTQEYALTPGNLVSAHFGKRAACATDGTVSTQPLWASNLTVNGTRRNVVFVATQHDGLFAFDADASPCVKLWSANLIDSAHGGTSGETPVPFALLGVGDGDISPEVGVTGTPVIDPSSGTLFVVSKSVNSGHTAYFQRLHAINVLTGLEKPGSPVAISATFPGTNAGGTTVSFDPLKENQRPALAFANGLVYIAWAAHEDSDPWYGWIMGYQYDGTTLSRKALLNTAPNKGRAGVWMSGGAPAVDASGKLYVITGNGNFDATSTTAPNNDYGDSLLQLTPSLAVSQWFTPSDELYDDQNDKDFGSSGAALLADLPAGNTVTHALICGGKDHFLYVINRDLLGGFGDGAAVQRFDFGNLIFTTGAFWNNTFYLAGFRGPLRAYSLNPNTVQLTLAASSTNTFGFPGAAPSVSASGTTNGIVWTVDTTNFCTPGSKACGPAVLRANAAGNVATELWNSSTLAADAAGNGVKFTALTVANGHVYVGTRGNNTGGVPSSTSIPGELDIYGFSP